MQLYELASWLAGRAAQLARRKAIYEALHPETKKGVAQAIGMNASIGNNVAAESAVTFTDDAAAKTGLASRTIREEVQIATRIPEDVRELLRATPVAERSPRPTATRQNGAHGAITARDGLPPGNPEKTAWRGYGKAWRGLRRRPEADTKLTACTTKKAARQPGARGSTGGAAPGDAAKRSKCSNCSSSKPSKSKFAPPLARGRGNAHRGGFWRGGFCENMYTRCTRRFSRYANEATTA